uniref:Ras-GEF domain-containing protein n=1 Tax=Globodera pallida TaxID=36090 RepID=A0A183CI21_GLOPA
MRPRVEKLARILHKKVEQLKEAATVCRQNSNFWGHFEVWAQDGAVRVFKEAVDRLLAHQSPLPENMYESINYFAVDVIRRPAPLRDPPPGIRIPTPNQLVESVVYDPVFQPDPEAGPSNALPVHVQEQPLEAEQPAVQAIPRHSLVPVSDASELYRRYKEKYDDPNK